MKINPQSISKKSAVCGLQSAVSLSRFSVFGLRSSRAFTLMELLVVLAVIGLLTGLLFPALMGARERAKITRARSEIQTIQQAWLAYWNTYGQTKGWPAVSEMNVAAVEILAGIDTTANPQKIAFMEFDDRHLAEGFLDPWRNLYRVELTEPKEEETKWAFTTRVHLVNTARYRY